MNRREMVATSLGLITAAFVVPSFQHVYDRISLVSFQPKVHINLYSEEYLDKNPIKSDEEKQALRELRERKGIFISASIKSHEHPHGLTYDIFEDYHDLIGNNLDYRSKTFLRNLHLGKPKRIRLRADSNSFYNSPQPIDLSFTPMTREQLLEKILEADNLDPYENKEIKYDPSYTRGQTEIPESINLEDNGSEVTYTIHGPELLTPLTKRAFELYWPARGQFENIDSFLTHLNLHNQLSKSK